MLHGTALKQQNGCRQRAVSQRCIRCRRDVRLRAASVENNVTAAPAAEPDANAKDDEPEFEDSYQLDTLTLDQVQELLSTVSEETNIAEVSLKLDDLEVRFRRSAGNLPAAAPTAPAAAAPPAMPVPPMSAPMGSGVESVSYSTDDEEVSFSTVPVLSQKVGVFRRCRYVGTKQVGKSPMINEGTGVKTGQPMGYVEQLGTFNPVEAPMDGEVVAVLLEEGDPVAYDQELFEIVPGMASSGSRIK
eukprot:jgi/Ulvmu1/5989/UM026_0113.1